MPPTTFDVSESAQVDAPAAVVYELIADYRSGHPRIVPPEYFSNLTVEEGGYGAGTRIRFDMKVLGTTRRGVMVVEEPEPGRVLVERDPAGGAVTTFIVDPSGPRACRVTIATALPRRSGIAGAIERFVSRRLLRKVYRAELSRIGDVAASRAR